MPWFGGPCRELVKYTGGSLTLSGLAGPDSFDLALGSLNLKREVVQAAVELVQLLDTLQYSNCVKIEQLPRDSPERVRIINDAMDSERHLIEFTLLSQLLLKAPSSERLQQAFADWLAAQALRVGALPSGQPVRRRERSGTTPKESEIQKSVRAALRAEPRLQRAVRRKEPFDFQKVIDQADVGSRRRGEKRGEIR